MRPGVAMTDLATGLYAHGAIMAALLQQQRTGQGSHIDCNLLSSQVSETLFSTLLLLLLLHLTPRPHQSPLLITPHHFLSSPCTSTRCPV